MDSPVRHRGLLASSQRRYTDKDGDDDNEAEGEEEDEDDSRLRQPRWNTYNDKPL